MGAILPESGEACLPHQEIMLNNQMLARELCFSCNKK